MIIRSSRSKCLHAIPDIVSIGGADHDENGDFVGVGTTRSKVLKQTRARPVFFLLIVFSGFIYAITPYST
jgi:hypothetical protein